MGHTKKIFFKVRQGTNNPAQNERNSENKKTIDQKNN